MKVPINWLKEYVDISNETELVDRLTFAGHMQDGPPEKIDGSNVYDLEVRQNRPDCLSLIGIAREAGAVLGKKIRHPQSNPYKSTKGSTQIEITDPELCFRFNTVTIEDLKVSESPQWLKNKLNQYGIKSVNNLVDITNYVMVEQGQPLHAFDKEKIHENTLIIRPAKKGESVLLLGNKRVSLTEDDVVIADPKKVVALAGVMGGEDTSVSKKTTSIILEAATYNQATVRRSSLRHQTRTEASTRLEKFLNPKLTEVALQRALELILKECGGKITDTTDNCPKVFQEPKIKLSLFHLNRIGGIEFTQKQAENILKKLELNVSSDKDTFTVTVPYFRTDLEIAEDLVEEILRIHGYEDIPVILPGNPPPKNIESSDYQLEEELRDLFARAGFDEQITEPLTNESNPKRKAILLENSLNADKTMLRTTLKNSLLDSLNNQLKFRKNTVKLFEIGKVYYEQKGVYEEEVLVGVIATGMDYFSFKGLLDLLNENFETNLNVKNFEVEILDKEINFFEISLTNIKKSKIKKPLIKPPQVIFQDISLFVSKDIAVGNLLEVASQASDLLTKVELGEEPKISGEQKSIFLHLQFESPTKNLTKTIVDKEKEKILTTLKTQFKALIR